MKKTFTATQQVIEINNKNLSCCNLLIITGNVYDNIICQKSIDMIVSLLLSTLMKGNKDTGKSIRKEERNLDYCLMMSTKNKGINQNTE